MSNSKDKGLNEIIRLMESDNSIDAPSDSIKWAQNLFRTREKKPSLVTRLIATLRMDLLPGKPAFGERSGAKGTARQMLFNAGENAIELRIISESSHVHLKGQVLGEGFADAEFALSGTDLERRSNLGKMSEFEMLKVPKGFYTLTFTSNEKEIVIEQVDI